MLTGGWRLGVEYLHVGFDTASSTASVQLPLGAGAPPFTPLNMRQSADLSSDIVRVKVNYAFGAPVVAKY
jgi:outer membrane immunogenic protein